MQDWHTSWESKHLEKNWRNGLCDMEVVGRTRVGIKSEVKTVSE